MTQATATATATAMRPLQLQPEAGVGLFRRRPARARGAALVARGRSGGRPSASELVREFYDGVNRRDMAAVEGVVAEGCVYEDLVFPRPLVGRHQVLAFLRRFTGSISPDLVFVIDDISGGDDPAVGVTWHLEWKGRPFPFSRGCSFYRCSEQQIVYARDCVEPAAKPGELALLIIRGVTWILERFPGLARML